MKLHQITFITALLLSVISTAKADMWPLSDVPRSGDDELKYGVEVITGRNGICETAKHPLSDDVQVVPVGQDAGINVVCITAGPDGILGYHPEPRGITTLLGEPSIAWMRLHEGVDMPASVGLSACLATRSGTWSEGGSGEQGFIYMMFGGDPSFMYLHTAWDDKDGEKPNTNNRTVGVGEVVSRVVEHSAYPHLHIHGTQEIGNGVSERGYINMLRYFTPQYDPQYPAIPRYQSKGKELPKIYVVPDKSGYLGEFKYVDEKVTVTGDADIVVQAESRAWNFFQSEGLAVTDIPIIPYEAKVSIKGPDNYTFARTLFRMDVTPVDGNKSAEKADLIYHKFSVPYDKFYLVLTNSDGTENFDYLNNVEENCWPVSKKDEKDNWLVPDGEYTIKVTVRDYAGATTEAEKVVVVSHEFGTQQLPKKLK